VTNEEEHVTETAAPDTERTDDAAFTDDATEHLGDATEVETNEQAGEEDGSSPDEPQPETFPPADDETPADGGDDDQPAAS
jgi:hypothetical protein